MTQNEKTKKVLARTDFMRLLASFDVNDMTRDELNSHTQFMRRYLACYQILKNGEA